MEKTLEGLNNTEKSILSSEVLKGFFTKENISTFITQFRVIFSGLALLGATQLLHNEIDTTFNEVKFGTSQILNQHLGFNFNESQAQEIQKIFDKVKQDIGSSNIENEIFQKKIYDEIKAYDALNGTKLLQSLLLGFLYAFAYMKTINRVKKDYMKIDLQSFSTFSLTSGAMVLVNGFVPGSMVYAESFLLAGWAVYLHLKNVVNDKHSNNDSLNEALNLNPIPTSRYDEKEKPIVWNKALEKETGYSHKEVLYYFEKKGEIMTLLYKGENLEKVQKYLTIFKETGRGYEDVAFTMTTKSGEEKTFLWTTQPDPIIKGGNLRFARHITDLDEIKKRLAETEALFKIDTKTGAFNEETLIGDFNGKINDKRRKTSFIMGMFDIDYFKAVNDKLGHDIGDKVLIELVKFFKSKLRDTDIIYRLHGDEFAILFESDNINDLSIKLNLLREEFFTHIKDELGLKDGLGTSWGLTIISPSIQGVSTEYSKEYKKIDQYMYVVKYLYLIEDILVERGVNKERIPLKNAIAYPINDEEGKFIGLEVKSTKGTLFIKEQDFYVLIERKILGENGVGQR